MSKKRKTPRTPTDIALFKINRRLNSIETIIGMDDENWPLPENITATTPLGLVLHELGLSDEDIPRFIERLKERIHDDIASSR